VLDLNDMVVFERVAREGSFTAAAQALGLSRSGVSERISRLEARLGVRLLHRTTRQVRLTETGRIYYDRCVCVVHEAQEAERSVAERHQAPHGVLRLTAPHLFGDAFLTPVTSAYLLEYPDVSVEILLTERRVDLIQEEVDLAIRVGHLKDSSMIVRKLGQARSITCASPAYLEAHGVPSCPDDLAAHHCVVVGDARQEKWPFVQGGAVRAVPIQGRLTVNSLIMGRDAALAGVGVAWLPSFLCRDALDAGDLQAILREYSTEPYPIYAAYPSGRFLTAQVRAYLDLLVEQLRTSLPRVDRGA